MYTVYSFTPSNTAAALLWASTTPTTAKPSRACLQFSPLHTCLFVSGSNWPWKMQIQIRVKLRILCIPPIVHRRLWQCTLFNWHVDCSAHRLTYAMPCPLLQAARANSISQSQGLSSKVNYQVADALHQPFRDGQFDLIWSMESGEHMPDKAQFIKELTRVCKPGGKILIVTWCHRLVTFACFV